MENSPWIQCSPFLPQAFKDGSAWIEAEVKKLFLLAISALASNWNLCNHVGKLLCSNYSALSQKSALGTVSVLSSCSREIIPGFWRGIMRNLYKSINSLSFIEDRTSDEGTIRCRSARVFRKVFQLSHW